MGYGEDWTWSNWQAGYPDYVNPNTTYVHLNMDGQFNLLEVSAASTAVIEWSDDCNGDGIVDYGQILDGVLLDDDCDGIPDVCQIESIGALLRGLDSCSDNVHIDDCDGAISTSSPAPTSPAPLPTRWMTTDSTRMQTSAPSSPRSTPPTMA